MSRARHTPGPWRFSALTRDVWPRPEPHALCISVADGPYVAEIDISILNEAGKANARADAALIAAAPDLLQSLRDLLADAETLGINDSAVAGSAIEARKAIAKAEGRS